MGNETTTLLQKTLGEQIEVKMLLAPDLQPPCRIHLNRTSAHESVFQRAGRHAQGRPTGHRDTQCRTAFTVLQTAWRCAPGTVVQISVCDTVIMDTATLERIFEPFSRQGASKGTGLGLATVSGIVNQHGGILDVHSGPGKGTAFRVYLRPAKVIRTACTMWTTPRFGEARKRF